MFIYFSELLIWEGKVYVGYELLAEQIGGVDVLIIKLHNY